MLRCHVPLRFICSLFVLIFCLPGFASETLPYRDSSLPIDKRVDDLLARMTLEEKVAQLESVWFARQALETDDGVFTAAKAREILGIGIGQIARPSENKTNLTPNKTPAQTVAFTNAIQKWLLENTRLGIPAVFHEESLHGNAARDATSFPQAIALASTWSPTLIQNVYSVVAEEVRARGAQQVLAPVLDVARDPRWGRIEETMGEDPYLVSEMGVAAVRGYQGEGPGIPANKVVATLKHLAGHGEPSGGQNIAPTMVGPRGLREIFLPPFEAAVKVAGARSVMASYNEIDGIPSHSNVELLQDILRGEWGFKGVLVSDYTAIPELMSRHHLSPDKEGAALFAFKAGVDVETPDPDCYRFLPDLLKKKKITLAEIDAAVARVLREKFALGLFENPYTDPQLAESVIGNDEHRALAQQAAEKAMVLLKNDGVLPLNKNKIRSLALIGPYIDETLLGGYSDVPRQTVSIHQGLSEYLGNAVKINAEKGTLLTIEKWDPGADSRAANSSSKARWHTNSVVLATPEDTRGMMAKAVAAARKSDVAIVVVGDNEATSREAWVEQHLGDRASLNLLGEQQALVDAVLATGKPTVVLLIGGRPLAIPEIANSAPAIIEGWYLGQETGRAVARVLFGDVNPGGKLPVSMPRSVGQLPVYYNHKPTAKRGYEFESSSPLFPFGFGLSYTNFRYSDLKLNTSKVSAGGSVEISMTLTNTGAREGDEVVQLYVNDPVASVTQPVKSLKGFQRVSLAPGASRRITFTLAANELGFYDRQMNFVLEPGKIKVMLGSSSDDIRLQGEFDVVGPLAEIAKSKVYFTPVKVDSL